MNNVPQLGADGFLHRWADFERTCCAVPNATLESNFECESESESRLVIHPGSFDIGRNKANPQPNCRASFLHVNPLRSVLGGHLLQFCINPFWGLRVGSVSGWLLEVDVRIVTYGLSYSIPGIQLYYGTFYSAIVR
jgi:hypothetical protein